MKQSADTLKKNKIPGEDNINSELFKLGGTEILKNIQCLIAEVWRSEQIETDWKMIIICPIFKKSDTSKAENYRGINLQDFIYKILTTAILRKLKIYTVDIIGIYECHFTKGKSTNDLIFVLSGQ